MKKTIFVILFISLAILLNGQDTNKVKEVGITFTSLNNFGLTYRFGKEPSLWRINTIFISGNKYAETRDSVENYHSSNGYAIKIGHEFRKELKKDFWLRYGIDISFRYDKSKREYKHLNEVDPDYWYENIKYVPGINLIVGLNYIVNDNVLIGAELLPNINWTFEDFNTDNPNQTSSKLTYTQINYGISNSSILLSIIYKL